jgi:hypothetical protein
LDWPSGTGEQLLQRRAAIDPLAGSRRAELKAGQKIALEQSLTKFVVGEC